MYILLHNSRGVFTLLHDNSEYTPGELQLSLSFYLFFLYFFLKKRKNFKSNFIINKNGWSQRIFALSSN